MGAADAPDDVARRRRRTDAYCSLWGLPSVEGDPAALDLVTVVDVTRGARSPELVRQRLLSLALVALKGEGLSQHEVFAIADAWELWDHLSVEENDFVLEPSPDRQALVNHAWRFEGVQVLAWSLGLIRHLAFPDTVVDTGAITALVVRDIAPYELAAALVLRPRTDLLDAADIARRCQLLVDAGSSGSLHPGIVFERNVAFDWLLPPA